jgi:hypothetical protein
MECRTGVPAIEGVSPVGRIVCGKALKNFPDNCMDLISSSPPCADSRKKHMHENKIKSPERRV